MKKALATFSALLVSTILTSTSFAQIPSAQGGGWEWIIRLVRHILDCLHYST